MSGVLLLAGAPSAAAGIRFAGPGGTGVDPCNDFEHPCSIFTAADRDASGTTLKAGDEVILAPGSYSDTAGDLGPVGSGPVQLRPGISLHGEVGAPRPVITLARPQGQVTAAFAVDAGEVVSHLEINAVTALGDISITGGTVEDVIARGNAVGARVCNQSGGLLRDSVCLNTGPGGSALGLDGNAAGSPSFGFQLRNVTAVATGAGSAGLQIKFSGTTGHPTVTVNGIGVIARGAETDVRVEGLSIPPDTPGAGANVLVTLTNSAYKTIVAHRDGGGGSAAVSPTGPGTSNIEAEPLLAADGFHQLPNSPTVGKGATGASSGATDIDGQQRTVGLSADIGADELASPTATELVCSPAAVVLATAGSTTCTATVTDISATPADPSGNVQFTTSGGGAFSDNGVCALAPAPDGRVRCELTYSPSAIDSGNHRITATYSGDEVHPRSAGHAVVRIVGAIRFAGPGGQGKNPCDEVANPCPLFTAAGNDQGASPGDEVVMVPGTYSDGAEDFGASRTLRLEEGISLHGQAGRPRPLVRLSDAGSKGLLATSEDTVSHLEIDTAVAGQNLRASGAVVEDVVSRSSAPRGNACVAFAGTFRNSACLSSGQRSSAILVVEPEPVQAGDAAVLRNVTAVASGGESTGLIVEGASPNGSSFTVDAGAVIVRGTEQDVLVRSGSAHGTPGTGSNLRASFDHSDYVTVATETDGTGGTAAFTHPGTGTNIEAPPLLAADGFHELPGSPTVNAGATDELSAKTDIDGQSRTVGAAADIGADELVGLTATTVACAPATVAPGAVSSCTATVTDTAAEPSTPEGSVAFAGDGPGSFGADAGCVLAPAGVGKASCRLSYTTAVTGGERTDRITSSYPGDLRHEKSQGTSQVLTRRAPNGEAPNEAPNGEVPNPKAPNTRITKRPRNKTVVRTARFAFVSDQPGSSFQCKLDRGPFRACRSPFKRRVKAGRHVFQVRAINHQGMADPTPAVFRWKVGKVR